MRARFILILLATALLASAASPATGLFLSQPTVARVIDGDTIQISTGERVRLLGIDAPEKGQPLAMEATAFLRSRLRGPVALEPDRTDKDKYGRLLRYVRANGELVEEPLLSAGLARVLIIPPDQAHEARFRALEAQARAARLGIWAFDQSLFCIGVSYYHANAAGDDRKNLNDEYITLRNGCEQAVTLANWTLGDASKNRMGLALALQPHARITIHSGSGRANSTDLYWGSDKPIWNNAGDSVLLWNSDGRLVLNYTA